MEVLTADTDDSTTECVSRQELAAVKAEMESKVDQLHSKVHYWQNVTVNTLKDHCSPLTSGTNVQFTVSLTHCHFSFQGPAREGGSDAVGETLLVSAVFNITHCSKQTLSKLSHMTARSLFVSNVVLKSCAQHSLGEHMQTVAISQLSLE